jgi:hypothetical protein
MGCASGASSICGVRVCFTVDDTRSRTYSNMFYTIQMPISSYFSKSSELLDVDKRT